MNDIFDKALKDFEKSLLLSDIPFCVVPSKHYVVCYYIPEDEDYLSTAIMQIAFNKLYEFTSITIADSYLHMKYKDKCFRGRQIIISKI